MLIILTRSSCRPCICTFQIPPFSNQNVEPARISETQESKVRDVAKYIYEILKLDGFSRSEFIFKDGKPYLLEVNTVPGFTRESILPQQALNAGISLSDLFHNAIEEALQKNH